MDRGEHMQANAALEVKLPRAIVRKNAELQAKYGGNVNQPNEPETPAETPAPPIVPGTTAESPTPPDVDPRENDPAHWKHRFNVTSGILRAERDDRKVQVSALNRRIDELSTELQAAREAIPEPEGDLGEFFTPEQVDEMGEPAARAMYNVIKKQVKTMLATELKPIREKQAAVETDERQERVDAFHARLEELVPDFVEIDTTDEWKEWLAEDSRDGILRQKVLDTHVKALNAEKTAAMFKEYLTTKNRPAPPITPNGTGATPPSAPPKGPAGITAPTPPEIREFYKRKKLNKVSPQEVQHFEARMELLQPR